MSTRRTIFGNLGGGNYGLRTTLPGFDVITDDPTNPNKFSFNSDWTDMVAVHQIGVFNNTASLSTTIPLSGLSYIPYVDVRQTIGNVVCDSWVGGTPGTQFNQPASVYVGYPSTITAAQLVIPSPQSVLGSTTYYGLTGFYIVYRVPQGYQ